MGRKSPATIKNAQIPEHITNIAMTSEQYYELKVYIKSVALPGTPAFEGKRSSNKGGKQVYRQWLNSALEGIGPKLFPQSAKGLVWPKDRDCIYNAVHRVVRSLGVRIRQNYKKRELRAARGKEDGNKLVEARDGGLYEGKNSVHTSDTDGREDNMTLDEDEKYAQWEQEEEEMMALMMAADRENQGEDTMEEGMDAEPIDLEDLFGLMKPEVFSRFPNLADEYFDWDEILDPKCPEPVRHPTNVE